MALTEQDELAIERVFNKALSENVPSKLHTEHHAWITTKIQKAKDREAMIARIKEKLLTLGITGITATVIAMVWYAFNHGYGVTK